MYNTDILPPVYSNKIFGACIKFYELIKLSLKPFIYKDNDSKEYLPYILNAVAKGYTILDIGSHKRGYFFDLFKISKFPGRLIAFETSPCIHLYLLKMKQLMNLENIVIEQLPASTTEQNFPNSNSSSARNNGAGATVINFKDRINIENKEANTQGTIDNYCSLNFVIPALIKFKLDSNELDELRGGKDTLQKYKPQILIECVEGRVSRETLLKTFKFLTDLNYSGYFILDTIKVPLDNFDFNVYQNEALGFYCNNFIFE